MSENTVSLKLPPFWASEPQIWFAQGEAQFALLKIFADDTKDLYVFSALDQAITSRLNDSISNPQEDDKYDTLRARLVETFNLIELEWAALLLHFQPLGNTKSSTLTNEMLALLSDNPSCFLFLQLFLGGLPEDMCTQLTDANINDCRQLAWRADRIWAARQMIRYATTCRQSQPLPLSPFCLKPQK